MSQIVENYEKAIDRISPENLHGLIRSLGATAEEKGVIEDVGQILLRLQFDGVDLALVVGVAHKDFQDEPEYTNSDMLLDEEEKN